MTASLPVPHDAEPVQPDDGRGGGEVVPLAPAAKGSAKRPQARARAAKARQKAGGSPRPRALQDPGPPPPPPIPAELAAAGIVVPPKPPLPADERADAAAEAAASAGGTATDAADTAIIDREVPAEGPVEEENPTVEKDPEIESTLVVAREHVVQAVAVVDAAPVIDAPQQVEAEPAPELEVAPVAERVVAPPAPEAETAPEPEPEAVLEPEAVAETVPEVDTAPEPEAVAETVPEIDVRPEPEAVAELSPEIDAVPEPDAFAELDLAPAIVAETADAPGADPATDADALVIRGVSKSFGDTKAVEGIDLTVPAGTFYGLVGPNGAGKTTTLSMIAGLLRPDRGSITVAGVDAASRPLAAKRMMGVLPDRLRTFDRLTGRQLLYYYGVLRGLSPAVVESRTADLARAFDLTTALGRSVSDYSAGMVKKVMLAGALIHSPRLLVLDEPFESVDPVSSAIILDILSTYVAHGGTVILSSHGMELVERVCSRVAVIVAGQVLAEGTIDEVRGELTLEQRFIELAGGLSDVEGLEWLHTFSG